MIPLYYNGEKHQHQRENSNKVMALESYPQHLLDPLHVPGSSGPLKTRDPTHEAWSRERSCWSASRCSEKKQEVQRHPLDQLRGSSLSPSGVHRVVRLTKNGGSRPTLANGCGHHGYSNYKSFDRCT